MRVRVKLIKSVATLAGTFQQFTGDLDERTGIVWLDEVQTDSAGKPGRRVMSGMGVVLSEGATVVKLPDQPAQPTGKASAKGAPAA